MKKHQLGGGKWRTKREDQKFQKGGSIQKRKQPNKDSNIKQEGPAKEKTKEQTMV
jgi:hypothetical protein